MEKTKTKTMKRFSTLFFILFAVSVFIPIGYGQFQPEGLLGFLGRSFLDVTIKVPSDVQNGAFNARIRFAEEVEDFVQSDVVLAGTATASITGWSSTDDLIFIATITPVTSGTVIIGVPPYVATDAGGSQNNAATPQTVTVDVDAPSVGIDVPSVAQSGAFEATLTFTESVSDFEQSDLTLSGTATATVTAWASTDDTVFTATITPTTEGDVVLSVAADVATDAANNNNTASETQTVTIDMTSPGVSLSVPEGIQNGAFDVTITFTESVSDFEQSDLTLSGTATATVTAWASTDDTVFTATITPTTEGEVVLSVAADVATDAASNNNTASETQTVTIDMTSPGVSLSVPADAQNSAFEATITFTESVSDFEQSDLTLSGTATATVTAWASTDDTVFTATLTPTTDGTVVVSVAADVATDAANNNNTASETQTVTVDITSPDVSISVPADAQNSVFEATITFTESVSDFEQSDLTLSGTATATVTAWASTDDTVFTATLTPTTEGEVVLSVAADVATDAVNNNNTAAETQTVTVDMTPPDVSISVPEGAQNDIFDVTLTFTESVSGFEQADLMLSGTATATVTALTTTDNTVFIATLTPTTDGEVVVSIPANVATDAAGNNNTASLEQTVTVTVVVWIPDDNLRAAVRNKLGLANGDTLTKSKMTRLTFLSAGQSNIADLTGLEYATRLNTSDLSENSISDVSHLKDLTNLKWLDLRKNSISDVSHLKDLTKLTWLHLSKNSISDASHFSKLTNLARLYLESNSLSDVSPLKKLTNLKVLSLNSNSISDVSHLSGLTRLTKLELNSNSISDVSPLSNLTNLEELDLRKNSLSDVSHLSDLTKLEWLLLNNNSISDVSGLKGLTRLEGLYLESNSLSDVSPLKNLTNLTELYLAKNSISDVSPLKKLTSLGYLHLYNNSISDVSALSGLKILRSLKLSGNPISDTSPLYDLLSANDGSITHIDIDVYAFWDVNEDGSVDANDVALVTAALGQSGDGIVNSRTDVNRDGTVDNDDLTLVTDNLDDDAGAPAAMADIASLLDRATLESLDPEVITAQLSILRAKSDGSLKYQRAIALLESMLVALRPVETLLLANYPNPFNPETWLPYHLANAGAVVITIYDMRGSVVRRLELGHQREGYYTSRARAAYWDGRNHIGERVASGIYFYQLEADDMSLLRKMVILK